MLVLAALALAGPASSRPMPTSTRTSGIYARNASGGVSSLSMSSSRPIGISSLETGQRPGAAEDRHKVHRRRVRDRVDQARPEAEQDDEDRHPRERYSQH